SHAPLTNTVTLHLHDPLPIKGKKDSQATCPPSLRLRGVGGRGRGITRQKTRAELAPPLRSVRCFPSLRNAIAAEERAGGYSRRKDRKSTRLNSSHATNSYAVY